MQLPQSKTKSLVNLTPLIDVVFILLIFFMLASNFNRWNAIDLSIGDTEEITVDPLALSIVFIKENTSYSLNKSPMPLEKIIATLRETVSKKPGHTVVIQAEEGASVQSMVDVLSAIKAFTNNVSVSKQAE